MFLLTGSPPLQVLTVREILSFDVDSSITARIALENFAAKALTYAVVEGATIEDLEPEHRMYVSDEYKVCASLAPSELAS